MVWLTLAASDAEAQSQAAASGAAADVVAFLAALDRAVTARDRTAVAALVDYPITVQVSGLGIPLAGRDAFVGYYDALVTEPVVEAVTKAHAALRARRRDPAAVVVTDDSVFIGGRAIVARRVTGRYRIVQLTVPAGGTRWRAATRSVQTLAFRRGEPPARRRGALARGEHEVHVVHIARGRLLSVRVDEVAGDEVVATLFDHVTGAPLDARAGAGVRVWRGRVRADTDVRIVVTRRGGARAVLGYLLTVDSR